jgi:hypothetical protein
MSAVDVEAWLEQNTFWCPRLHARMRPEQCAANRKRSGNRWSSGWFGVAAQGEPITQCANCRSWERYQSGLEATEKEGNGMATTKKTTCWDCGGRKNHTAHGLCSACYTRRRKQGLTMDREAALAEGSVPSEPGPRGGNVQGAEAARAEPEPEAGAEEQKEDAADRSAARAGNGNGEEATLQGVSIEWYTPANAWREAEKPLIHFQRTNANLNKRAQEMLRHVSHVKIGLDRSAQVFAMLPTDPSDSQALRVTWNARGTKGVTVSIQGFRKRHGFTLEGISELQWHGEMIVARLDGLHPAQS